MTTKHQHRQLIDGYFEGALTPEEKDELTTLLQEDADVRKDFENMRLAVDSIKAQGFRDMLNGFQREFYPEDAAASVRAKENIAPKEIPPTN
jgi:hypothetical protein